MLTHPPHAPTKNAHRVTSTYLMMNLNSKEWYPSEWPPDVLQSHFSWCLTLTPTTQSWQQVGTVTWNGKVKIYTISWATWSLPTWIVWHKVLTYRCQSKCHILKSWKCKSEKALHFTIWLSLHLTCTSSYDFVYMKQFCHKNTDIKNYSWQSIRKFCILSKLTQEPVSRMDFVRCSTFAIHVKMVLRIISASPDTYLLASPWLLR